MDNYIIQVLKEILDGSDACQPTEISWLFATIDTILRAVLCCAREKLNFENNWPGGPNYNSSTVKYRVGEICDKIFEMSVVNEILVNKFEDMETEENCYYVIFECIKNETVFSATFIESSLIPNIRSEDGSLDVAVNSQRTSELQLIISAMLRQFMNKTPSKSVDKPSSQLLDPNFIKNFKKKSQPNTKGRGKPRIKGSTPDQPTGSSINKPITRGRGKKQADESLLDQHTDSFEFKFGDKSLPSDFLRIVPKSQDISRLSKLAGLIYNHFVNILMCSPINKTDLEENSWLGGITDYKKNVFNFTYKTILISFSVLENSRSYFLSLKATYLPGRFSYVLRKLLKDLAPEFDEDTQEIDRERIRLIIFLLDDLFCNEISKAIEGKKFSTSSSRSSSVGNISMSVASFLSNELP